MRTLRIFAIILSCSWTASAWIASPSTANKPSLLKIPKTSPNFATGAVMATLIVLAPFVTASAAQAADVAAGQKLFEANCAACHAGGQNLVMKEKTLQKDALSQNVGLDAGKIKAFVQNSGIHRGALMFGGKMSDDDFTNVASFVLDQAVEDKW
jgi:cytochrome c6